MEVVIVKMPLEHWSRLEIMVLRQDWLVKEQYFETEEILEKERELEMTKQSVKDLYKELKELKHPKK